MAGILFIKTSSLGDVVHHMPAVTDARRRFPDARITWAVEEDYAPLVRLHPDVDEVMVVAVRRWRRQPLRSATWGELREFLASVRRCHYDSVIDTQGLTRSALMAWLSRGERHGYDAGSARESLAAAFYDVRHAVDPQLHAIDRNRELTGRALRYQPVGDPDYGLARVQPDDTAAPYAVLLHGSARPHKEWPPSHWMAVGAALQREGLDLRLPWGNLPERRRSEAIAGALDQAQIPDRQPLDQVARLLAGARLVVGVDTGLAHLAAALSVPLVAIFIGSDPQRTGPRGAGPIAVVGRKGALPPAEDVVAAIRQTLAEGA